MKHNKNDDTIRKRHCMTAANSMQKKKQSRIEKRMYGFYSFRINLDYQMNYK